MSERKPVSAITAERFAEMLNILPPRRWRGVGEHFESFFQSEGEIDDDIVSWFLRYRSIDGEWFYTLEDSAKLTQGALYARVMAFRKVQALKPGSRLISIKGECDDPGDGTRRETGPNAIGTVEDSPAKWDHYPVTFENGTSVLLTPEELADLEQYTIL